MDIHSLPKIELHLHLDCSLSYDVVQKLVPGITREKYRSEFRITGKCSDLVDYINRAESAIKLMQSAENLKLVVQDLFQQLNKDRVIYAEIRFAPLLHIREDLTPQEVIEAVSSATEECVRKTGIEAGIILCTLRHFSEEESITTAELVKNNISRTRVCGFDIAADESGYPIDNHISAFRLAHDAGIPCTAHAGEACGPESVQETLDYFHPSRIGHGVRSLEDEELTNRLLDEDIHLEVCPTSNIKTRVFEDFERHNIDQIFKKGISLSVNTDGRALSDVTLNEEYQKLKDAFRWTENHFKKCNLEAIRHAFTSDEVKERIRNQLLEAYFG
ncbi:MAG: adenosine deaminase [Balneolaceae bacterium]|nr:adenosine deaminase [Balneolaceae bacterium]